MAEAPGLDLQQWIVSVLEADAALSALVGDGVYDAVPAAGFDASGQAVPAASPPYVRVASVTVLEHAPAACAMAEVDLGLIAVSRAGGKEEAQRIADAVREAIATANLAGTPARTWGGTVRVTDVRVFPDPDGISVVAAINARALLTRPTS